MANTDNANGFRFAKALAGYLQVKTHTLESGQTVADGDALVLDRISGKMNIWSSTFDEIYGFAAEACDASSADADCKFIPALPWYVFEGQCSGTYDATMLGIECDIEGTTGIMEVNENAHKQRLIKVIDKEANSEVGANTRVLFVVIRSSYMANPYDMDLPADVNTQDISTDTTLDGADSGYWNLVTAATDVTITLPATGAGGYTYNVVNAVAPGAIKTSISPESNDKIMGVGNAGTDNKDVINTKATAKPGDSISLVADGSAGWYVAKMTGTWAFEA